MKSAKHYIKGIAAMLFLWPIFYLSGAFYNVSLNIAEWSEGSRWAVSLFGPVVCLVAMVGFVVTGHMTDEQ